jgi:hypothetical protein
MNGQDEILSALAHKLKNHDWFYMYSDDGRVASRGSNEAKEIRELIVAAGEAGVGPEAQQLFEDYKPKV